MLSFHWFILAAHVCVLDEECSDWSRFQLHVFEGMRIGVPTKVHFTHSTCICYATVVTMTLCQRVFESRLLIPIFDVQL